MCGCSDDLVVCAWVLYLGADQYFTLNIGSLQSLQMWAKLWWLRNKYSWQAGLLECSLKHLIVGCVWVELVSTCISRHWWLASWKISRNTLRWLHTTANLFNVSAHLPLPRPVGITNMVTQTLSTHLYPSARPLAEPVWFKPSSCKYLVLNHLFRLSAFYI